jgi:sugar phosphate permease
VSIVNWFSRHRAKAVALSQVGYSLGGLAVPVVIICLEAFGWRTTAFYSGVMVIVVGFPLVLLVRHRPQDYGELVDGGSQLNSDGTPMVFLSGRDFTARQAMRTSSFWLISMGHACALLTVSAIMVHLVSHLTESLAYSLAQAGLVVAALTGFQMLGQIGGGFIGDRFNKQLICVVCMICHTAALFLIANATELWMVILFTAMHGLAWGIRGPLMVALRADYFGPSSFGTIMGFSSLIVMLGMSIGPIYAGYMADIQGDYVTGFSVLGIGALLGSLCFVFARAPVHPDNDKLGGEK